MVDIKGILSDSLRSWLTRPPCDEASISSVIQSAPVELPSEYLDLLRHTDGGEGPFALPPLYFVLYPAEFAAEWNAGDEHWKLYPGYFVFGSSGGLESIAFELRKVRPLPIVMYDPVAGVESAILIAEDMGSFVIAIGLDWQDEWRLASRGETKWRVIVCRDTDNFRNELLHEQIDRNHICRF